MSVETEYDRAALAFAAGAALTTEQRRDLINAVWAFPRLVDSEVRLYRLTALLREMRWDDARALALRPLGPDNPNG